MADIEKRYVEPTLCQVARGLPENDDAWTFHPWLEFMGGDEGAGQVIGSANFRMTTGVRTAIGQARQQLVGETNNAGDITGQLVRVLARDDAGDVDFDGTTWSVAWTGKIIGRSVQPQGKDNVNNGAEIEYQGAGMGCTLDQLPIDRGYALASDGSTVGDPGYCPRFNHLAGGDRSATTTTVAGASVYVHQLGGTSGNKWTARQILELILATYARPTEYVMGTRTGWEWSVSDPDSALAYEPEDLELNGMTVFQAIVTLCGPRRGLTFFLRPVGAAMTVLVRSGVATAITVGTFTLPASTVMTSFDVRNNLFIDQPVILYDYSNVYDVIELRGNRPWVALTVDDTQMTDGWSGSQRTIWDANPDSSLVDPVFRRLVMDTTWNGLSAGNMSVGLRNLQPVVTSSAYGDNGRDGSRSFGNPNSIVTSAAMEADRMLPCSEGFSTLRIGPRQPPMCFVAETVLGYSSPGWIDACAELKWSIQIEGTPPAVRVDDGVLGASVQGYRTSGLLAFTVGFREFQPLSVCWRRPQSEWPCELPRCKLVDLPQCEQWIVLDGTMKGVSDSNGTPILQSGDLTVRDDVPQMRQLLALYRAFFTEPAVAAEITDRAILDTSAARRPGTLVTAIITGNKTYQVNAVITRRRFVRTVVDGVPMWATHYSTERIVPELEAIL